MKKETFKQTIIIGVISILGVILVIGGYIFSDAVSRANQAETESSKEKVTLVKNVPTEKELSSKKAATKVKQISTSETAKDTTAPTITAPEETIEQNAPVDIFEDVTANDNKDGDITAKLATTETVDTSVVGTQTVHFSVTDSSGNQAATEKTFHIVAKSEPIAEPQVEEPVSTPAETTQAEPAYAPMTITMAGQTVSYQNGGQGSGQSIIDSNPAGVASTWGGAAVQSGDDGQNTHFIGHNPDAFSTVFSLGVGSQIVVTDANGTPTTYTVRTMLELDDYGEEVGTGRNYWDLIVGTGGGERISLQSCVNDDINLFAIAYK